MAKNPIYKADQVGIIESVVNEMLLLDPYQVPLLSLLGFGSPITNVKHEWVEDELEADKTAINNGAGYADNATSIVVDDGSIFAANEIIKIGEELLKITAISTNTLTVTRGYAGTTAAALTDNQVVEFMFVEGVEGADARTARKKPRVRIDNITQIFDETIEISGTALAMSQYGINDPYDYEKAKKLKELSLQFEKALINGVKYETGQTRQMKGMRSFITTNVDTASGPLTMNMINDLAQDIFEKGGFTGGSQHVVLVPAKQKRALSTIDENKINIVRQDNVRGQVVDSLVTDFGQFPIILDNNLNSNELMLVDLNRCKIRPLANREFFHEYMGKKGDYVTGQIVGEYTLEFKQEKAHGRIRNLA
ncbi:hypothetical protein SAMN05444392_102280 [Seinonella peptonophila]|uniref:Phage major capsid protein, HK97 family n=1 Tax=Seinonella peptonophila TaxID=112248 RepID=A0A1M4VBQ4_9BACL|nr:DUF5309 family protein [Seinonella peptonophila]SHE66357.1 hypothetical protein SAMN05444392_102280 [Seinonella peptonophila]